MVFYILSLFALGVMLLDYVRGRTELLTLRNLFLLGLIYFQFINAPPVIRFPQADEYGIGDVGPAAQIYALWCTIFLIVFLVSYEYAPGANAIARKVPIPPSVPKYSPLWGLALAALPLAFVLRAVPVPYVGVLADFAGLAVCASAAGLAAYLLFSDWRNPVALLLSPAVFAASAAISSIGEFSRRPLVSVAISIVWGAYYAKFRTMRPFPALVGMGGLGFAGLVAVALFTAGGRSLEGLTQITDTSATGAAVSDLTETYGTARIALWLIDQKYEQDNEKIDAPFLLSIKYIVYLPVPRAIWGGKPYTVSTYAADWANLRGVRRGRGGVTNPAGIVGNGAPEGGLVAVVLYAMVYAWILRYGDQFIRRAPWHPLVVIPIGSVGGDVFGMPRGESANFMFAFLFGSTVTLTLATLIANYLDRLGYSNPIYDPDEPYEGHDEHNEEWAYEGLANPGYEGYGREGAEDDAHGGEGHERGV